ncbi:ATP-binding cassette domain-containing protein [Magnetovirga frankeli]|uniref:ABC transporter ATP-binding protein n=1 Tax=Magnetovirga frankeli TaxID=947516 RepID=UPI001293D909|nr:ATP-binding cassette domain-containing protein [gamma proteobacterium SS-5]
MADLLKVENIRCSDAEWPIRKPLSLRLKEGEIGVILALGRPIADTLLRAIQGQVGLDAGRIVLAGDPIAGGGTGISSVGRNCRLVPADGALVPHLSVAQNIQLVMRGLNKRQRQEQLDQLLDEVDLLHAADLLADHLPAEERQRTALARALVAQPQLLLWQEPFAPYPEGEQMALVDEIEQILQARRLTCLITTANVRAGMALAQRLGVCDDERLLQWDSPERLYHCPAQRDVARATGNGVFLQGFVQPDNSLSSELGGLRFSQDNDWIRTGRPIEFLLRPEHVRFEKRGLRCATITSKRFLGGYIDYRLLLEEGSVIPVTAPSQIDLALGKKFCFRVDMPHLMVFRPDKEEPVDLGRAYSIG